MPRLQFGDYVWVDSPDEVGKNGVVIRRDGNSNFYWVKIGDKELCKNRKHLDLLYDNFESTTSCNNDNLIDNNFDYQELVNNVDDNSIVTNSGVASNEVEPSVTPKVVDNTDVNPDVFIQENMADSTLTVPSSIPCTSNNERVTTGNSKHLSKQDSKASKLFKSAPMESKRTKSGRESKAPNRYDMTYYK